jgi:hypothetical protein
METAIKRVAFYEDYTNRLFVISVLPKGSQSWILLVIDLEKQTTNEIELIAKSINFSRG